MNIPEFNGSKLSFSEMLSDASHYWEPRRIRYNFVLAAVVIAWLVLTWPHFMPAFSWQSLFQMVVLALLANVCYSAAYLFDFPLQHFGKRSGGHSGRNILWCAGTLLAVALACYWIADEIYPYVG